MYFILAPFMWRATIKGQPGFLQKKIVLPQAYQANSRDVIETTPGNYVMLGYTIDTLYNQLHQRLTLAGLDQNGSLTWRKSYGNNNFAYTPIVFSAGMTIKKDNFLYATSIVNDSNQTKAGVFLKFNYTGDTVWQKKYYENGSEVFLITATPSVDNGFLITGAVQTNTPGFNNHPIVALYLLKTDANGNKLWDKKIYRSNLDQTQVGYKVVQDSASKKIIIAGNVYTNQDVYATAFFLDSLGNIAAPNAHYFGISSFAIDIIQTKDKNFIMIGSTFTGPIINTERSQKSALVKFDLNQNTIAKFYCDTFTGINEFNNIRELNDGDLIAGGSYSALFNQGLGLNVMLRLVKYDKNLNFLWKKYFDTYTNNTNREVFRGLNITAGGGLIFAADVIDGQVPKPLPYIFYKTDTSYCDINAVACYNVGINEHVKNKYNFAIYPNPGNGIINFNLETLNENEEFSLEVINITGRQVKSFEMKNQKNNVVDISSVAQGIYLLQIKNKQGQLVGISKLIKN